MRLGYLIAPAILYCAPASAADLSKAMNREPDSRQQISTQIAELEKCLFFSDFHDLPMVYRPIGRTDMSLIYYSNFGKTPVIKLEEVNGVVNVALWNDVGSKLRNNLKDCIDKAVPSPATNQ